MQIEQNIDEFCPSCGKYKPLVESVGFCLLCTRKRFPDSAVCSQCGKIEIRGLFKSLCNNCEKEAWLERNADKIESYMRAGLTFSMAVVKVLFDNRPLCLCCGNKIKWGRKGKDLFCAAKECRTEARYMKYLREVKGKSREDAIEIIVGRLNDKRSKQVA